MTLIFSINVIRHYFPGNPKPLVTAQFTQKVSIQITLHQRLQKRKKEETTIDFDCKEGQLSEKHKFIFFFPLPYSGTSNLGKIYANFSGETMTSLSVLDHQVKCYVWPFQLISYLSLALFRN